MKDVVVTVRCAIEPVRDRRNYSTESVKAAVVEAVEEALSYCEARGFNHQLSDDIAIVITGVSA